MKGPSSEARFAGWLPRWPVARIGWEAEVLERATEFTEVSAGLSLRPNGLRALDALGVGEAGRGRAVLEGQADIRDSKGWWLSGTETAELERRYGPTAIVHRAQRTLGSTHFSNK